MILPNIGNLLPRPNLGITQLAMYFSDQTILSILDYCLDARQELGVLGEEMILKQNQVLRGLRQEVRTTVLRVYMNKG